MRELVSECGVCTLLPPPQCCRCGQGCRGREALSVVSPAHGPGSPSSRSTCTTTPATMVSADRQPTPDTARRLEVRLRATLTAAAQARRALRALDLPLPLADHAQLAVSELVTNSVRHAQLRPDDRIRITVDWSGTRLRVHVRDGGRHLRPAQVSGSICPTPGAESGWGLYLVDRLSSRWGIGTDGYWFELRPE
jgi:serine/threonine-protein kinase RsbW